MQSLATLNSAMDEISPVVAQFVLKLESFSETIKRPLENLAITYATIVSHSQLVTFYKLLSFHFVREPGSMGSLMCWCGNVANFKSKACPHTPFPHVACNELHLQQVCLVNSF